MSNKIRLVYYKYTRTHTILLYVYIHYTYIYYTMLYHKSRDRFRAHCCLLGHLKCLQLMHVVKEVWCHWWGVDGQHVDTCMIYMIYKLILTCILYTTPYYSMYRYSIDLYTFIYIIVQDCKYVICTTYVLLYMNVCIYILVYLRHIHTMTAYFNS